MANFVAAYWPLILAFGVVLAIIAVVEWLDRRWGEDEFEREWESWAKRNGVKR